MTRQLSSLIVAALLAAGLTSTVARAGDKTPPRFNGPYHQNRNPYAQQNRGNSSFVAPAIQMGYTPGFNSYYSGYVPTQFPVEPTWNATPFPAEFGAATTAAAAEMHGAADFVRSIGEYNLNTSQAMINAEQARTAELENRQKKAEVFYEKRRIHDETVAADRECRAAFALAHRTATPSAPVRTVEVFNGNGALAWPSGLSGTEFQADRQSIDGLMSGAALSEVNRKKVQELSASMQAKLLSKLHNHEIKTMDYLAAKKFLASLETGTRSKLSSEGLAQR